MSLVYRIIAKGGYTPLEEFSARQTRRGVSAAPRGKPRLLRRAFMAPSLGSHMLVCKGNGRFPIQKLQRPTISAEMVKAESKAAFEHTVSTKLPARLAIEANAILAGRAPRG